MKVTLCRDLTILFTMLAMVTHVSAADAILEEDEHVSDYEDDFVEDSFYYTYEDTNQVFSQTFTKKRV